MEQIIRDAPRRTAAADTASPHHAAAGALRTAALCIVLLVVAAVPRLANLNGVGFHGDEDITAFAVQSAYDTGTPQMPSGMPYLRALPHTWLTAASLALFGGTGEAPFRLPSALFGMLTVPLLFLLGRSLVGARVAVIAAVLLALSQVHLYYSQHARMYAVFLFTFVAATFAILAWLRNGRRLHLVLAVILAFAASTIHLLGTLLACVFLVPYLTEQPRVRWHFSALAAGVVAALALAYNRYYVIIPYREWQATRGFLVDDDPRVPSDAVRGLGDYLPDAAIPVVAVIAIVAALIGLWLSWRGPAADAADAAAGHHPLRRAAIVGGGAVAAMLAAIGQLYGAGVATLLVLIITPGSRIGWVQRIPRASAALAAIGAVAAAWMVSHVVRFGVFGGFKAAAVWPYVLPVHLARQFLVPMLVFASVTLWLAARQPRHDDAGIRLCVLLAWLPLLALGFVTRSEAIRYLLEIYPFILLAVAAGLMAALDLAGRHLRSHGNAVALAAGIVLAASGLLTGHGVPHATAAMRANPASASLSGAYPYTPDHRSAARWLAAQQRGDDIVIAEDQLALRWYGVQVDHWFRRFGDTRQYLYRDEAGVLRDYYGESEVLADTTVANAIVAGANGRVWFVTSGETHLLHSWYLSESQRVWLDDLQARIRPSFVADDSVTSIYCLNCGGQVDR